MFYSFYSKEIIVVVGSDKEDDFWVNFMRFFILGLIFIFYDWIIWE